MNISTILDLIDSGDIALPKFQRGYVWNRDQVRGLMDSLYRRHPVGSLLVWATAAEGAPHRGEQDLSPGVVRLLLDGQQRVTSLYGIIRGTPPAFFDGHASAFADLYFHLEREEFRFYQRLRMKDDPLWIDVSALMKEGNAGLGQHITRLGQLPDLGAMQGEFIGRLNLIVGIRDISLHIEEVTGTDKTIDVVVDIFNRVNSGGTKLSQGDLALAKICGSWPEGRERMQSILGRWRGNGYDFNLDWLLRNVNAIVTGEARFLHLHDVSTADVKDGLARAERSIDYALNLIAGRLGLDHDRVLFGRYALPVLSRYIDKRGGHLADTAEQDRLLHWYFQSAMWGRFSGSTETTLDRDYEAIEDLDGGLDRLLAQLRLWHGSLRIEPEHFRGWSLGARFYPVLYALTRVGESKDWGTGLVLKNALLGRMNALEVHHIFPKALLYRHGYHRSQVNAVANFCFLTKNTNLKISDRAPAEYFVEIEKRHPGALGSQWIPMGEALWETRNYPHFLEERQRLLAAAANALLGELLHGETQVEPEVEAPPVRVVAARLPTSASIPGGIEDEEEEAVLRALNEWVRKQGLPDGQIEHELSHPSTGDPVAILDLAWPNGLQAGYSEPVALLLGEEQETLQIANDHGFRHFTTAEAFKRYVETDVLALARDGAEVTSSKSAALLSR
ncbi:GmrSD restriction endonuclease domain-containing protein [Candidatus Poriferisodalis sp.]|uniref:GmrSD restriction endonuclease domain-containing protein n=1 Tax=Candidatus Poriferisodalis sp. TaxID=3101277 RepID=UPI003B520F83